MKMIMMKMIIIVKIIKNKGKREQGRIISNVVILYNLYTFSTYNT